MAELGAEAAFLATQTQWGGEDSSSEPARVKSCLVANSQLAALQRELRALETRYFRTREQLEKRTATTDALRLELRTCRANSVKMQRETVKLRHLIDRIQNERQHLEKQAIRNRDYAHKMEQKLFPAGTHQSIVQSNLALQARVETLQRSLAEKEAMLEAAQRDLRDAQGTRQLLERALEMRWEELQLEGNVPNGLLFELATLQEHNAALGQQLARERELSRSHELSLEQLQKQKTDVDEALVVREAWLASLEKERGELHEQVAHHQSEQQTASFEKATLLRFIQEQAETKLQLEARVQEMGREKTQELEAFHAKLQQQFEIQKQVELALQQLQTQLEQARRDVEQAEQTCSAEQQTSGNLRAHVESLQADIQRLDRANTQAKEELQLSRDTERGHQTTIVQQEATIRDLKEHLEQCELQVAQLQQELAQKHQDELALRAAMENALHELEVLQRQRNEAAHAMNEAVTISASSLEEQRSLETKVETQRQQLEQLKHAKNLLQRAMMEQLGALRKQLQVERLQRIEAQAKLTQATQLSPTDPASVFPLDADPTASAAAIAEDPHPLAPPSIKLPSPLPPELTAFQSSSRGSAISISISSTPPTTPSEPVLDLRLLQAPSSGLHSSSSSHRRSSSSSGLSSPTEGLSLLQLAGDLR